MLDAACEAAQMAQGKTRTDLDTDRPLNLSLVRLLEIVGEAASRVPVGERARLQQYFSIGIAADGAPCSTEFPADLAIIVDFPVEGYDVTPVGRMHRLRAAWTEIDDRETTLPEYYPRLGLDPYPPCIGPAVKQRLVHPFSNRAQFVGGLGQGGSSVPVPPSPLAPG